VFPIGSETAILDTGAQVSNLLYNIHTVETSININGIGKSSHPISTNTIGYLPGLDKIPIYVSKDVKRNILSFNDVNLHYEISWDQKSKSFSIANDEEIFNFKNTCNVFSRNFQIAQVDTTTVEHNKSMFTSKEVQRAELAREIETRLSCESSSSLIQAIKTGSILGLPITVNDVQNSVKIFGPNIAALKGKSVAKQGVLKDTLEVEKAIEKHQTLRMDTIYCTSAVMLILPLSPPLSTT
jgi:hypothetical protein